MPNQLIYRPGTGMAKQAAGDDFEQKLAQMADAEISQSIPALSPNKIGFQLIDKNDEETRGVGVMVYKMREQWVYVPAFFLNGRLRGYEMMYLPDRAQFVPTKDNWLSYLHSKQPLTIGEIVPESDKTKPKSPGSVQITDASESILLKNASLKHFDLGDMLEFHGYAENMFDLRKWLPRLGKQAAVRFMRTVNRNPDFANAVMQYYSPGEIVMMVKEAGAADSTPNGEYPLKVSPGAEQQDKLMLVTKDTPDEAKDLNDAAKEVLMRDGVFVIDERPETSTVFKAKDVSGSLHTPTDSGWYELLMADGSFRNFYVAVAKRGDEACRIKAGEHSFYLIPEDRTSSATYCNDFVLGRRSVRKSDQDISGLGMKAESFVRVSRDEWRGMLLIDRTGTIMKVYSSPGKMTLNGSKMTGCYQTTPSGEIQQVLIEFTGHEGSLHKNHNTIYVPDTARVVRIGDAKETYLFGDLNTIKLKINKSAALKPLKIYTDGHNFTLSGIYGEEAGLNKIAAMSSLCRKHGIHAADAKQMLHGLAGLHRPFTGRYMVKYALDVEDILGSSAGQFEDAPDELEEETIEPDISANDIEVAINAAGKGVKDVMDVSVLRALAMSRSAGRMINDYIADLLLGMDRVGRILFMFYWHNEDFKERYGSDQLMELEDSLRDVFHGLSDLILFLHKSTLEPSADLFGDDLAENIG